MQIMADAMPYYVVFVNCIYYTITKPLFDVHIGCSTYSLDIVSLLRAVVPH